MAVDYTFARPSPATVVDHEGIIRNCKIDEARFQGARRVENITDVTAAYGTGTVTSTYLGNGEYEAIGFDTLTEAYAFKLSDYKIGQYVSNEQYRFSFDIKCELGEDIGKPLQARTARISYTENVGHASGAVDFELGSEYQRITTGVATNGPTATGIKAYITGANVAITGNVFIKNLQLEFVTSQSNQNPSEYVSNGLGEDHGCGKNVDGVKYFDYKNGNTVDANGVVTEAKGSAISGIAYLNETAATNYFLNSSDPANQTISALNGNHVFWINGTGSMTLSGSVTGVVTEGTPIIADPLSGDVLCTIAGDVTIAQVEAAPGPTSYIPTAGAAVARAADALSYTGVNVHEDFVAGCDVTPLFDGDGLADSAGRMFGTEDSGTDEVLSIGSNAPGFTGSGGGGTFDIDKSVLIGDTRTKRVFTLGEDAMIYADGSQVYSNASGITPDHTDMSIYQVGRFNTDVLPCLYHAFQLFDQPLTDEQLVNLSKPGTNPKGCS